MQIEKVPSARPRPGRRPPRALLAVAGLLAAAPALGAQLPRCPLLGTDAAGRNLLAIDPQSASATVVGSLGFAAPALATDPLTGTLYAGEGQGSPNLWTVDPATAAAVLVGPSGLGSAAIASLEFDASGALYAAVNVVGGGGSGADHLALLDPATGLATVLGPFGDCSVSPCTLEGMEAIAFDGAGALRGILGANGAAGTPGLYTIDPVSGQASFDVPLLDAQGQPPAAGFVSLQFCDCDGLLYAGTARTGIAAADGGHLATIDPSTGRFTLLTTTSLTGGESLGGLARRLAAANSLSRNGSGVNPATFVEITPAVLGGTWRTTIDIVTPGAVASFIAAVPSGPLAFNTAFGELLIDVSVPFVGGIQPGPGTHAVPVPLACGLIGLRLYTQGATFRPGTIQLTNALDIVLGTF